MRVTGGKSIYGTSIGILMLEARFPRIPGDMGNALTWPFPVHYRIVRQATPDRVVRSRAEGLLGAFIEAGRDLVRDGVDGITTNCGFLSLFQDQLAQQLSVPVATSSLMQVPLIEAILPPGQRAGILTISAETLSEEHLKCAGVAPDIPIAGTEGGREFTRAILNNEAEIDVAAARQDNIDAAEKLCARHPTVAAIVLECTNMVPYARAIAQATGRPVYSIYSFVQWFQSGLAPRRFPAE
jgi:Asp/Glu/hydantoin racemase